MFMLDKYYITLAAGTRVSGAAKYGSSTERAMHDKHVLELKQIFGERLISYDNNTGFIQAWLSEQEANDLIKDYRILRVSKIGSISLCERVNFNSYTISKTWPLGLLSSNIDRANRIISGFELEITKVQYGIFPLDYDYISEKLVLKSAVSKFLHNGSILNFEYEIGQTGVDIINLSTYQSLSDGVYNIVYDTMTRMFKLDKLVFSHYAVIGVADIVKNNSQIVYYYSEYKDKYEFKQVTLSTNLSKLETTSTGEGVEIIIGDTHIDYNLAEFEDRASLLYNPYYNIFNSAYFGEADTGFASHGTLVACAAAGKIYGIAKSAKILGVTLFDYSEGENPDGSSVNPSDKVIEGLQYIAEYIDSKKALGNNSPTVVNLSIKMYSTIPEVDDLIEAMIADGAVVVIAAGNDNVINNHSPYSDNAIVIAACNENLQPSSFTEYGPRVDLYAPGENIEGLMNGGIVHTWSGTSVACPIVSGVVANYLSINQAITPIELKTALVNNSVEAITYNKLYTTNKFIQYLDIGSIFGNTYTTNKLSDKLILSIKPFIINSDTEKDYGSLVELTLNSISNVVVSSGSTESIDIGSVFKLQI